MKFKATAQLKTLANESGLSIMEFSESIIKALFHTKAIEYEDECMGLSVKDAISEDTQVKTLVDILYNVGIPFVTNTHYNDLMELVLLGDDDCPKCGGKLEVIDGKYRRACGDGYLTPFEYEPEWEDMKCTNCGHVQIGYHYNYDEEF